MGCQRCRQHLHSARQVRSTAHANNRFSVRCSPPLYLSRKNASFQPHIAGHKPSVLGRNPGDFEVDKLLVTHCLWRWTKHLRRKLEVDRYVYHIINARGPRIRRHSGCSLRKYSRVSNGLCNGGRRAAEEMQQLCHQAPRKMNFALES